MAQLNAGDSDESPAYHKLLWGISHLLSIGLVSRFQYNYRRYNETKASPPDLRELRRIAESVDRRLYALRGLLARRNPDDTHFAESEAAALLLRQQTYDALERLHHRILYLDADLIDSCIPLLDKQLRTWNPNRETAPDTGEFPLLDVERRWKQLKDQLFNLPLPESH